MPWNGQSAGSVPSNTSLPGGALGRWACGSSRAPLWKRCACMTSLRTTGSDVMTEVEDQRDWYADENDRLAALLAIVANSRPADVDPRLGWVALLVDADTWSALGEFRSEPQ